MEYGDIESRVIQHSRFRYFSSSPCPLDPYNSMLCRLIALNGRFIHSCPALFYVRGALQENLEKCRPEIAQYTINDAYYPTLRRICSNDPAALFFSTYIWNSFYIKRLIQDILKLLPTTPIILGGPQAKALVLDLPSDAANCCTLVQGEIESVEPSFYRDLAERRLRREYSCAGSTTAPFKNPYAPDDFTGPLKNRQIYYESSRGCPFSCTYCLSASESGVRHLPTSQVFAELKEILRFNPKVIRFVDRTFNDRMERALEIWRFLAAQPGETLFHFEMAPDRFSEEMFRFLEQVEPGRFQFELGVQSTNPQTLEAINRKCDLARLGFNMRRLAVLDTIHLHLDLILGLPHENRESYMRSFADVFRLGPHYIQMGLLKVLPDTPISRSIEEYDLLVCDSPPYEVLATRWLAAPELEELFWFGECVETFYNNRYFRSFWGHLRKTGEDIGVFFQALFMLCREKNFFDLAPTQELLSSLLLELVRERDDAELLREFLVFDWLRCGHHHLPIHLERESLAGWKNMLWKRMPQNYEPHYAYSSRDEFFKQGVFARFSGRLLQETGLSESGEAAHVCFQPEREARVFSLSRVLLIPGYCASPQPED